MHILLSQLDLDMIYYDQTRHKYIYNHPSERFLSNFRLKVSIDSNIAPYREESMMNISVLLEPLILAIGMRQIRKLMNLSKLALDFLSKMEEKYFPHVKPEYIVDGVVQMPPKKKFQVKQIFRKILIRNYMQRILI